MIFEALGDGYRAAFPDYGLEFRFDRIHAERHELHCELSVSTDLAGANATEDGIISAASFNLSSDRAKAERSKRIASRAQIKPLDTDRMLEEACLRVIRAERQGRPAIVLSDLPMPTNDPSIKVAGLTLYPDHPQILFGDGSAGKSLITLYQAGELDAQGFTVLFVDWELDERDHRRRQGQIYGTRLPQTLYVRCEKPLVYEIDRLRRIVRDQRVHFAILDSIAVACDGPPEAAEVAARYFRALRQLGIGTLSIAHINKSEQGDMKPFGSAFWHNLARSTWFAKATDEHANGFTVGLFNRKANLGPRLPAFGYEITFSERITFGRVDLADVKQLASDLPIAARIRPLLRNGPMLVHELATELGVKADSVEKALRRGTKTFTRINGKDGVSRWGLLSRDEAVA